MKPALIIIGSVFILGIVSVGIWFFLFASRPAAQPSTPTVSSGFPASSDTVEQTEVKKAFLNSIQNADQITLQNAVVVSPYALQNWGDENKGGQALLKYDSVKGWVLISLGGGAWDEVSLVQEGVPDAIAQQLLAKDQ